MTVYGRYAYVCSAVHGLRELGGGSFPQKPAGCRSPVLNPIIFALAEEDNLKMTGDFPGYATGDGGVMVRQFSSQPRGVQKA